MSFNMVYDEEDIKMNVGVNFRYVRSFPKQNNDRITQCQSRHLSLIPSFPLVPLKFCSRDVNAGTHTQGRTIAQNQRISMKLMMLCRTGQLVIPYPLEK